MIHSILTYVYGCYLYPRIQPLIATFIVGSFFVDSNTNVYLTFIYLLNNVTAVFKLD